MRVQSMTLSAVVFYLFVLVRLVAAGPPVDTCDLPPDLQRELASKYPGSRVVGLSDLQEDDRKFFQAHHDKSCPGLVTVDFYGDGKPTLALVLIPRVNKNTDLIVAHHDSDGWRTTLLGTGGPSPYAPAAWSQPPGKYQDIESKKTIRATRPVIVLSKYGSWAILYAWTGKNVDKIWLSD